MTAGIVGNNETRATLQRLLQRLKQVFNEKFR
jgi:hypothetical protein